MNHTDVLGYIYSHHMAAVQQIAPVQCERSFVFRATTSISDPLLRKMKTIVCDTGRNVILFCYDTTSAHSYREDIYLLAPATGPHAIARGENLFLVTGCRLWAPSAGAP